MKIIICWCYNHQNTKQAYESLNFLRTNLGYLSFDRLITVKAEADLGAPANNNEAFLVTLPSLPLHHYGLSFSLFNVAKLNTKRPLDWERTVDMFV